MQGRVRPVILAGGGGTRLWPLATRETPKHLLRLGRSETLLETTLRRVQGRQSFLPPIIVCSNDHAETARQNAPGAHLVMEPRPRNSAPAIAAAAALEEPGTVLLILPSDHHFESFQPIEEAIQRAWPLLQERIVTFGVLPTHPHTGYGHIIPGPPLGTGVFEIARFVEKPDADQASALMQEPCFWNSGMFLMKAGVVLDEMHQHAPEIMRAVRAALARGLSQGADTWLSENEFAKAPAISFDYAVMERSRNAAVAPITVGWSDLGTWNAIYDISGKDAGGNAVEGNCRLIDAVGSLVRSNGPEVVCIGIEDLIVIATAERVLVVPREQSQRVREAADNTTG